MGATCSFPAIACATLNRFLLIYTNPLVTPLAVVWGHFGVGPPEAGNDPAMHPRAVLRGVSLHGPKGRGDAHQSPSSPRDQSPPSSLLPPPAPPSLSRASAPPPPTSSQLRRRLSSSLRPPSQGPDLEREGHRRAPTETSSSSREAKKSSAPPPLFSLLHSRGLRA